MVNMSTQQGGLGWSGSDAQFLKLKILESFAIDANSASNRMYLTTKAPDNQLEKASIIDIVYNPLYIINEVTHGQTKSYVRSRTLIEVARTDGIACINVTGTENIIGR